MAADAGIDINSVVGDKVSLNGSGSVDDNNNLAESFSWALIGVPEGSIVTLDGAATVSPSFTPDMDGVYVVALLAIIAGVASNDTVTVTMAKVSTEERDDWDNVVGKCTLEDGGYVGDLLSIARLHLADAKKLGQLTNQEVGQVYAAVIPAAFKDGIGYIKVASDIEIANETVAKTQAEIDLLVAKTANEYSDVALDAVTIKRIEAETTLSNQKIIGRLQNGGA